MIPNTINIVGVPHKVMLCKDNFATDSHFGEIDYTKAEIKINQDLPEPLQMQALCHEWLHGALVMLGFSNQTQDEQFVQALSAASESQQRIFQSRAGLQLRMRLNRKPLKRGTGGR